METARLCKQTLTFCQCCDRACFFQGRANSPGSCLRQTIFNICHRQENCSLSFEALSKPLVCLSRRCRSSRSCGCWCRCWCCLTLSRGDESRALDQNRSQRFLCPRDGYIDLATKVLDEGPCQAGANLNLGSRPGSPHRVIDLSTQIADKRLRERRGDSQSGGWRVLDALDRRLELGAQLGDEAGKVGLEANGCRGEDLAHDSPRLVPASELCQDCRARCHLFLLGCRSSLRSHITSPQMLGLLDRFEQRNPLPRVLLEQNDVGGIQELLERERLRISSR